MMQAQPFPQQPVVLPPGQQTIVPWGAVLEVGLGWDFVTEDKIVDLDASCLMFNVAGRMLDCVFYNQTKSRDGSVIHSGDNRTGLGEGDDELITINTSAVHTEVQIMVFMVTCFKGGSFADISGAHLTLRDPRAGFTILQMALQQLGGGPTAVVLAVMFRDQYGTWYLRNMSAAGEGRNIKEAGPLARSSLRFLLPDHVIQEAAMADARSGQVLELEKGRWLQIPGVTQVRMGLGWDMQDPKHPIDLDASIACFNRYGEHVETIYFGNKSSSNGAILHSGDNLTGEGDGDDEQITIHLDHIDPRVNEMICAVTIYTAGRTFQMVRNVFCRLVNMQTEKEVCRYTMSQCGSTNALVMCKITKDGNQWKILAIGEGATGRTPLDLTSQLIQKHVEPTEMKPVKESRPHPAYSGHHQQQQPPPQSGGCALCIIS